MGGHTSQSTLPIIIPGAALQLGGGAEEGVAGPPLLRLERRMRELPATVELLRIAAVFGRDLDLLRLSRRAA